MGRSDLEYPHQRRDEARDLLLADMRRGFRRMIRWNVGSIVAMAGIVLAITRFV